MLFITIINSQEEITQSYKDGSNYTAKWDSCKAGLRCGMWAVVGLGKHLWLLLTWLAEQGLNQGCQCFRARSTSYHHMNQESYLCSRGLWQLLPCVEMHCGRKDPWHTCAHGLRPSFWLSLSSSNPFCMMTPPEDDTPARKLVSFQGKSVSCTEPEQMPSSVQRSHLLVCPGPGRDW